MDEPNNPGTPCPQLFTTHEFHKINAALRGAAVRQGLTNNFHQTRPSPENSTAFRSTLSQRFTVLTTYDTAHSTPIHDITQSWATYRLSQQRIADSEEIHENRASYAKMSGKHAYILTILNFYQILCWHAIFLLQFATSCRNMMCGSHHLGNMSL